MSPFERGMVGKDFLYTPPPKPWLKYALVALVTYVVVRKVQGKTLSGLGFFNMRKTLKTAGNAWGKVLAPPRALPFALAPNARAAPAGLFASFFGRG
jgi:hypothetical protein